MNSTSLDLLKTIQVCQDHPEIVPALLKAILEVSKSSSIQELKDCSIGCDQTVFYIKTDLHFEAIVKIPKSSFRDKDDSSFCPMHLPDKQAWLLKTMESQTTILCPRLIYLDPNNKFLIESFLPEANLKEIVDKATEEEMQSILNDLAKTMKSFHSLKVKKFGYISSDDDNHGKFDNWLEMFHDYPASLKECAEAIDMDETTAKRIEEIYEEQKGYLSSFNEPCLLHGDLDWNNMRGRRDDNGKWSLSGIIDFADVLSGDPLYDFGEWLGTLSGSWKEISMMEEIYLDGGKFTTAQRKRIRFYALYFCLWWLSGATGEKLTRFKNTLYNLANMKLDE